MPVNENYGRTLDGELIGPYETVYELNQELGRDCIEYGHDCSGTVEYRMPLSGTGRAFPRCEHHWEKRLDTQERINRDYPDSPCAPSWFDEANAGECWGEDY